MVSERLVRLYLLLLPLLIVCFKARKLTPTLVPHRLNSLLSPHIAHSSSICLRRPTQPLRRDCPGCFAIAARQDTLENTSQLTATSLVPSGSPSEMMGTGI
jgi:hypothetical protein